jgi:hypothetical protein
MSEQENFLARWSRLKRGDAESKAEPVPAAPAPAADNAPVAPAPTVASVDLSALPSIDSITATTDIRGFLAPGVPAELTRAALRKLWVTDPAIRDFVGIAENQWDFTAPDSIPGFGPLESIEEARKLVARVFGEESAAENVAVAAPTSSEPTTPDNPQATGSAEESPRVEKS